MIFASVFILCLALLSSFVDCVTNKEQIRDSVHAKAMKFYYVSKEKAICVGISFHYIHTLGDVSALLQIEEDGTRLGLAVEGDYRANIVSYVENDDRCVSLGNIAIFNNKTRIMCSWYHDNDFPPYKSEQGWVSILASSSLHYRLHFNDNDVMSGIMSVEQSQQTNIKPYGAFVTSYCDGEWTRDACSQCQQSCTYRLRRNGPRSCTVWYDPEWTTDPRYNYMRNPITTTVSYDWRQVASGLSQDTGRSNNEAILWWWLFCALCVFVVILVLTYIVLKRNKQGY